MYVSSKEELRKENDGLWEGVLLTISKKWKTVQFTRTEQKTLKKKEKLEDSQIKLRVKLRQGYIEKSKRVCV